VGAGKGTRRRVHGYLRFSLSQGHGQVPADRRPGPGAASKTEGTARRHGVSYRRKDV